jgi:hypothetical protein
MGWPLVATFAPSARPASIIRVTRSNWVVDTTGPDLRLRIEAGTDADLLRELGHSLDHLVEDLLLGMQARTGDAEPVAVEEYAFAEPATAASMFGALPPRSSETFSSLPEAARRMSLPTSVAPVKAIQSTSG